MTKEELRLRVEERLALIQEKPQRINAMVKGRFVEGDISPYRLIMAFPIEDWQMNPRRILHGGMTATLLDMGMGMLVHCVYPDHFCPTVSLSIQYIAPFFEGQELLVESCIERSGDRIIHMGAVARDQEGRSIARAVASFTPLPRKKKE